MTSRISNETIEKAIIFASKDHFPDTADAVNKLINYIYHYNINQVTLLDVKTKFLRKLFNKHSSKSYEHQLEDIEKKIVDEKYWSNFLPNKTERSYFLIVFEHYQSEIRGIHGKVLKDLELTAEEKTSIIKLLNGE